MSNHEKMLERVRALLAKAASTTHEAEAELFRAKADELMTKYAIEQWQVDHAQAGVNARPLPVSRAVDFQWYWKTDKELGGGLWSLFQGVARHCRCAIAYKYADNTIPVIGLPADLDYMDLLFTHLFMQMVEQMDPHPRAGESMIEALVRMKEAGIKWEEAYDRLRKTSLVEDLGSWSSGVASKMDFAGKYTRYCREHGRDRVRVMPTVYRRSFAQGFAVKVKERLNHQREDQGQNTGSMALALRDISLVVNAAMLEMFPDMGKRSKAVAVRDAKLSTAAMARGAAAGERAQIITNAAQLKGKKELPS